MKVYGECENYGVMKGHANAVLEAGLMNAVSNTLYFEEVHSRLACCAGLEHLHSPLTPRKRFRSSHDGSLLIQPCRFTGSTTVLSCTRALQTRAFAFGTSGQGRSRVRDCQEMLIGR